MAVPRVNKKLLQELESMGFPTARATRALHYSGTASLEACIDWIVDHENDPDIDQMPLDLLWLNCSSAHRDQTRKKSKEEEKKLELQMEREREKERIRSGKELMEAKQILEDNERKRNIVFRNSEKEEEKRARERIRWKLEQDKLERRVKLGLPPGHTASAKLSIPVRGEIQKSLPVQSVAKSEHIRERLRSLRRNHKDDDARVRRAFQTLLIYVGNVAKNPDQEKFRKIRLGNPSFLDRVGSLIGGIEFLELCGFERTEAGEFLYLPRDKVDMATLYSAASELKSALTNPFFGLLSRDV
ncbi:UBX domain-containing protein 1 isoform X2 [Rosa chinensis]|uniref:UBX domain-containing protein 1 isoform X2 n=1 Tax=Rosa chinensis TaxID=74649 RepID=UPI000D086DCE|nr:UBX domain-containing protein 1 isoform X2 [Rosa chinensis]